MPVEPIDLTLEVKRRITPSICVNEGLWKYSDAMRLTRSRAGDYLCFSPYWVGSLRRFSTLAHVAHHEGQIVCKHTHGEFGLAAAAGQHMMLCAPNSDCGNQQTAQMMEDDILTSAFPSWTDPNGAGSKGRDWASRSTRTSSKNITRLTCVTASSRLMGTAFRLNPSDWAKAL